MRRLASIAAAILVLAALGAGAWWLLAGPDAGSGGQAGPSGPPMGPGGREGPLAVGVEPVVTRTVPEFRQYVATIEAIDQVEIRAQVSGYLVERPFTAGALVEPGEVLFRIDPRPFEARIERLEAELAAQEARRDFLRTQLDRFVPLAREEFTTEERIDELRSQLEQTRAGMRGLEAQIRSARLDLDYATIHSPVRGRVGFSNADVGDLIQAGGEPPLTTVVRLDPIYVTFDPTDTELDRLIDGGEPRPLPVEVMLPGDEPYQHDGTLAQVDNRFQPTTGTIAARAIVPNPDHRLRPGQFARARLILEQREDALLIPSRALDSDQGRRFVYRLADGTAEKRFVETGGVYGDETLILSGLEADDRVIVDRLQQVQDGMAVTERAAAQARRPDP